MASFGIAAFGLAMFVSLLTSRARPPAAVRTPPRPEPQTVFPPEEPPASSPRRRSRVLVKAGLGLAATGPVVLVSFVAISYASFAISYISEARAPGLKDAGAPLRVQPSIEVLRDYGPAAIYVEPELVLTANPQLPELGEVLGILAGQARSASPPPRAPLGTSTVASLGPIENVNITFYDCANQGFCGHMYGGEWVYEGAAACSWDLPLGTAFYIVGDPTERIYVCKDRGLLPNTWVDIFWYHPADGYNWQSSVGRYATIYIVYLPS